MASLGYAGKLLEVDLSNRRTGVVDFEETTRRKYLGGSGLAAKIVWEDTDGKTDPLSPESPLIFGLGPLTGANVPFSSRHTVAGLSPLTGVWGEGHSGGDWADQLKHAGFDAVIVRGQADKPVYLWIDDGAAEIREAGHVWGKDTYEVEDILRKETDAKASVACIGPAGEQLIKIACVMNDGRKGRAAARCGLGALMGSKKLKAIVVRGTGRLRLSDEKRFREAVRKISAISPLSKEEPVEEWVAIWKRLLRMSCLPIKNWRDGTFEPAYRIPEDIRHSKALHCQHCPYPCMESRLTSGGERHQVMESWAPLGTQCLVADVEALQEAYSLCNRYGLDSISAGGVVSFGIECFENGLINKADTGGIELRWGSAEAVVEMVRQIGLGVGFGKLLGEGVKRAADKIGGLAHEYAIHVKGLEVPAYDPRATPSAALTFATSSLGPCHQEIGASQIIDGLTSHPERKDIKPVVTAAFAELGFGDLIAQSDPSRRSEIVLKAQHVGAVINSLVVCRYIQTMFGTPPSVMAELVSAATGWEMVPNELLAIGERIINLRRMILVRRGISRKDDTLPPRFLTHKLPDGEAAGVLPNLGPELSEYYALRGWNEEGVPNEGKLKELDLEFCLPQTEPSLSRI